MFQKKSIFRWVLVIIGALASWYAALFLAIFVHGWVHSFCPPEEFISGLCSASWWPLAEDTLMVLFAGLSAVIIVLVTMVLAPTHKIPAAITAYIIGGLVAVWIGISTDSYYELIAALLSGGVIVLLLAHKNRAN